MPFSVVSGWSAMYLRSILPVPLLSLFGFNRNSFRCSDVFSGSAVPSCINSLFGLPQSQFRELVHNHFLLQFRWFKIERSLSQINFRPSRNTSPISIQFSRHSAEKYPYLIDCIQTDSSLESTTWTVNSKKNRPMLFQKALDELGIHNKLIKVFTPLHDGIVACRHRRTTFFLFFP